MTEAIHNLGLSKPTGILDNIVPNPFRNSTEIRYYIDKKSDVFLELKNSVGQTVAVLDNGQKTPGFYTIRFMANEIKAGLYFLVLSTDDSYDIKKVIRVCL